MNALILATALLLAAALQALLPAAGWLGGLRLELVPALVAYGALSFRRRTVAVLWAMAAGFAQDSLSAAPFGLSALAYLVVSLLLAGMVNSFDREAFWMQMLGGALASLACSAGALVVLGPSTAALGKALGLALLSLLVSPVLFGLLDAVQWRRRRA